MHIAFLQNSEWDLFNYFVKKNLKKNIVINKKFTKYWFCEDNKNWQIQICKNKFNKIKAVNMFIKEKVIFNKKKHYIIWTSIAYSEKKFRTKGIVGLMLLNLHRKNPIIVSTCANTNSLPLNNQLGIKIPNLQMKRFIYIHNFECLKLAKKNFRSTLMKNIKFRNFNNNQNLEISWTNKIPLEIDILWKKFSKYFKLCIEKNHRYLKKRYIACPFQKYNFLTIRNNNRLIGFVIIKFQKTKFGNCARIVDFISEKKHLNNILNLTLINCEKKKCLFIHVGNLFNQYFKKSGFVITNNKNNLDQIPNLLSPIDYRRWSNTFHLGGYLIKNQKHKLNSNDIWFTKGDGDRDWPTYYDI